MNRTKKRNNFTLSAEAQKIVDALPKYKKSGFVSEAIKLKNGFDKFHEALINSVKKPIPNYIKGGTTQNSGMAIVGEQGAELVKTESGYTFNLPKPKLFDVKITLATPEELDKIKSYTTNEEIELAANIEKWRVV